MIHNLIRLARALSRQWQLKTNPNAFARSLGVNLGRDCRLLGLTATTFGSEPYLITIGNHVTITAGVRFVTHDGGVWVLRQQFPDIDLFGRITIGHNVFIGLNTLLLPNITIGDNVVIGAGSVVTRDIPANVVAVGAPAKPIKSLEQYAADVQAHALHIRSLPAAEKRAYLIDHFDADE